MSSIRNNFFYKAILTLSSYIISFATFPYISRVLGVEGVGLVNFVDNSISYFLLFATMGVTILGTREIAMVKDDRQSRNRVFSTILGMNIVFTIITLIIYFGTIALVPRFYENSEMFYIGAAKIVGTVFLVEWFFTGLESFRYITIRSLIIKLLYVAAVYTFIDDTNDYKLYFTLTVATVVINATVNILYTSRFITIDRKALFSMRYLQKNVMLGLYSIMTSMYVTFNVMYLGLVSDNTQVGYYTTAFKLYTIILGLFSAFTSVMMPRMSAMLADGDKAGFKKIVSASFVGILRFIIPISICCIILAPQIIRVLSGLGYEGAVIPMRIIFPAAVAVGIAQVLAIQVLMPMKQDKVLLTTSILGAIVSLVINITIVPQMQSIGSAIVTLVAESVVTTTYICYVVHHKYLSISFSAVISALLHSLPPVAICIICSLTISNPFICLTASIVVGGGAWIIMNSKMLLGYLRTKSN